MNNYILYYYLREDFSSPFYVGYGKPRSIHAKHLRSNGANLLPSRERRWIVKSGLTKEEALQTITLIPAQILGIDKTVGTLEDGKDATLIISEGDILDMKSSVVTHAYIRGKEINLDDIQKQLYQKYLKKYKID